MEKAIGKGKVGECSAPRIAYPPQLTTEPLRSTPIIEIPDTPERPQFYTLEDFEEENAKLHELEVELRNQYEEKLKRGVIYLRDKIQWSTFFDQLIRTIALMDELNRDEVILTPLAQKWRERNNDITLMCISVIQLPCHQVEKFFDLLNKLEDFHEKRNYLKRRLTHCFSKYIDEKFNLFPCAFETIDTIKEKEKWKKELDGIFCERMNNIMTETGHWFLVRTNEELVKIQLFYNAIRKELDDLEEFTNSLITIQRETLSFNWPDDAIFNEWKN